MLCMTDAMPVLGGGPAEIEQSGDVESAQALPRRRAPGLAALSRDALFSRAGPDLVREDCRGLCTVCGGELNEDDPEEPATLRDRFPSGPSCLTEARVAPV